MGYRTLEISSSCEIHIKEGQLEVTSDSGSILIPIEDLSQIFIWLQENLIIKKNSWCKLPYNDIMGFEKTNCIIKAYI